MADQAEAVKAAVLQVAAVQAAAGKTKKACDGSVSTRFPLHAFFQLQAACDFLLFIETFF
ncbi:hypothetical protein [Heyndrickxia coagulans]|uniref:hypothetical protein n=1 Tax=Heyndrickxia coagulans TaxID=1398 RepID=UPI0003789540|nr:hypothetical protein [Heyndrickxia coagulans]